MECTIEAILKFSAFRYVHVDKPTIVDNVEFLPLDQKIPKKDLEYVLSSKREV